MRPDAASKLAPAPPPADGKPQRMVLAGMLLVPLLIILMVTYTNVDLALADAAFDRKLGDFPLRQAWWAEVLSHVWLKRLLVAVGTLFIALAMWDWFRPLSIGALRRAQIRIVASSAVLVPTAISLLKQSSISHCPWDLSRYGGNEPYLRLLDFIPSGINAGHCLPAGHASTVLWLISFACFFLPGRPRQAALAFGLLLIAGAGVGWIQQLRGAHFLSHTLWSAWIASVIVISLIQLLLKPVRPRSP